MHILTLIIFKVGQMVNITIVFKCEIAYWFLISRYFPTHKAMCNEVDENEKTISQLEHSLANLAEGHRSREAATLKTMLAGLRQQWQAVRQTSVQRCDLLAVDVQHWNEYRGTLDELEPYLRSMQASVGDSISCDARESAENQLRLHKVII